MNRPDDVAEAFAVAWNAHDMGALAALCHQNVAFVNRFGRLVHGVEEVVAMHAPIHAGVYSDSTMDNTVIEIIPLGEGAAAVHFWSRLRMGTAHPAGPHEIDTLAQAVMIRQGEEWRIRAFENVTLTDPRTGETVLRDR